jgi:hypothetical protein
LIRSRGGALSRNFELTIELFRQLSDEEYPVLTPRKPSADNTYYLSVERIPLIRIIYVGLYPLIFLVLGIVILIRRKSK